MTREQQIETNRAGAEMLQWARDLFPLHRSITGEGLRETLRYLQQLMPALRIGEIASGTQVFGWRVPQEWSIEEAYIEDEQGVRLVDIADHNLHLVGYSEPIDQWFSLSDLQNHLYSLPEQPNAIPYVTSYYKRHWGFCLTHAQRDSFQEERYHVVIDSDFYDGVLNYGELLLAGESNKEILISTYVCHPSMANNELSGPVLATALARWLEKLERRFSYRILFVPETIGAIGYLDMFASKMKEDTVAGFVLSCVGDERSYSMIPSRLGNTLADRVLKVVLSSMSEGEQVQYYSYLDRGSDERQYCSPGIDLPVVGFCRTKYGEYSEYHTSLDDFSVVTAAGLQGAFDVMYSVINLLENNDYYRACQHCEPQLGQYEGLYSTLSFMQGCKPDDTEITPREWLHLLAYADGGHDLIDLVNVTRISPEKVIAGLSKLEQLGLIEKAPPSS